MASDWLWCENWASREVRSIQVRASLGAIPADDYAFFELYCDESDCDCRRVLLQVIGRSRPKSVVATINFGWESSTFYTAWMHGDAAAGREIADACLDPLHPQSRYADAASLNEKGTTGASAIRRASVPTAAACAAP